VFNEFRHDVIKDRINDELAAAEQRRLVARAKRAGPSLRARTARKLFEAAVALDRGETWRVVWDRLESRGRL
jgi:hypothetical protein